MYKQGVEKPMKPFIYVGNPSRVVFGPGTIAQLPAEIARLGAKRVLVLCGPEPSESVDRVVQSLGGQVAGVYNKATMHVPLEVAVDARRLARDLGADCCVTVGGGSTTGLGKAIALTSSLPIVSVPTTYAGSEMTSIYGYTEGDMKKTGRDPQVLPKVVIYDPDLTLTLSPELSASSGMNAIAHCVEALYAHDANPVVSLMAEEGIRALATALPAIQANPTDLQARSSALYGAWLSGISLGSVGMGLHHKLCHVLGGTFNLPHAQTHAIILAHAARYNRDAAADAMGRIAGALDAQDAPGALYALLSRLGLPVGLREIGMPEAGLEKVARIVSDAPYPNPEPVAYDKILALMQRAYRGEPPQS